MKYLPRNKTESGFTLLELLVVILIIGILAAVAVPVFLNQRQKANDTAVVSDLRNAGMLIEGQGKFTGSLPADFIPSKGVTLAPMRTSDRDNKIASSQFADGNSANWYTFTNGASVVTNVVTNTSDGYKGMNYRRIAVTTVGTGVIGQYVTFNTPELGTKGEAYTVGTAMRHNYAGCRRINIEFKGSNGSFIGGISHKDVCFQKDQWNYYEFTGNSTNDGVATVVMSLYGTMAAGNTFDTTGAVMVKGDTINVDAALDSSGNDFCIVGKHENNGSKVWHYSSLDGGISEGGC